MNCLELTPANELDIVSLFGNLIENAIDGCLTPCRRAGGISALTTKSRHLTTALYIVSTNNFDGRVRKGKDGYRSTKHGGNGIGLAAIAAAAEKYGGSAQASNSGTEFYVDVVLKITSWFSTSPLLDKFKTIFIRFKIFHECKIQFFWTLRQAFIITAYILNSMVTVFDMYLP